MNKPQEPITRTANNMGLREGMKAKDARQLLQKLNQKLSERLRRR